MSSRRSGAGCVVTPLHNFAMPLIRYEIGDYTQVGTPCSCGRGLPVLQRIMGRSRNMLRLPDGTSRWPFLGEQKFRDIAPIQQFLVIQKSIDTIEVKLVVERTLSKSEETQLADNIIRELGHTFTLYFTYLPEIIRNKNGKFEDFISLV